MTEKRYTERELVLAQREAFRMGAAGLRYSRRDDFIGPWSAERDAEARYPLPKVTRPRVVDDPWPGSGHQFRCVNGAIQVHHWGEWKPLAPLAGACADVWIYPTPERIRLWYDLLTHPTEEVEDGE